MEAVAGFKNTGGIPMKTAIISDTHNLLRPEVISMIKSCDAVIHAGDVSSQKIIDQILSYKKADAPFYVVRGNNDKEWAAHLPESLIFTLEGIQIFMVHNKKDIPADLGDSRIVIYGHSHKYAQEMRDGRLWLNPGSCGKRRFTQPITMAVLYLEKGDWRVERLDIPHGEAAGSEPYGLPADLPAVVGNILRRMEKGQSVARISSALKVHPDFVETVCRIKVTHPGVTAAGIVDKMEVNKMT